ncbi:hypothetical protein YC2023_048085 [Brassica napus]
MKIPISPKLVKRINNPQEIKIRPTRETCWWFSRADGSFLEVSSHLQGRLMQSSHGGEGGDTHMLILLARED